eukprot:2266361-Pyramimonas_sp.AAC.1
MWFSLQRRAFFPTKQHLQGCHGSPESSHQPWRFGNIQDHEAVIVTLSRGVEVPGMAFWHDSRSSRRNCQVDRWRWSPENIVGHASRSSSGCLPTMQLFQRE